MTFETSRNRIDATFSIKDLLKQFPTLKEPFDVVLAYMEKYDLTHAGKEDFNGSEATIETDIFNSSDKDDWGNWPEDTEESEKLAAEIATAIIKLRTAFKTATQCHLGIIYIEGEHDIDEPSNEWVWYIVDAYPPRKLCPAAQALADSGVFLGTASWTEVV